MAYIVKFVPLSDANYFLNQAKGTPSTVTGIDHTHRCTRACVVLAFAALDGVVKIEVKKVIEAGYTGNVPKKIGSALDFLMH
jgi:hypothetical protein